MSRLAWDGTAEHVSRNQILRRKRKQGNIHFPCSADHEQDWQPCPADPYFAICDDHTYTHIPCLLPPKPALGYECGRVFPAGVGPDSPSRDTAKSSRFSRSVETRQRYGWLRIVFTRCASSKLQFGALREVVTRERPGALSRKAWSIR